MTCLVGQKFSRCIYLYLVLVVQTTIMAGAAPPQFDLAKLHEHANKGNQHLSRMNFELALNEYEECLRIDPSNQTVRDNIVLCHNNWGIYYFKQMKYALAKAQWERALKLNPADRNAKTNMAILKNVTAKSGIDLDTVNGAKINKEKNDAGAVLLTPGYKQSQSSLTKETDSTSNMDQSNTSSLGSLDTDTTSIIKSVPRNNTDLSPQDKPSASSVTKDSTKPEITPRPLSNLTMPEIYSSDKEENTSNSQTRLVNPGPNTIEAKLAQLEVKLYGKTRQNMPVLRRLEQLELDTNGKTKTGPVNDRVETLERTYGI